MLEIPCALIGEIRKEPRLSVCSVDDKQLGETDLLKLRRAWKTPLGADKYEA